MKKILYLSIMLTFLTNSSAFGVCSIEGGFCSESAISPQTIENKFTPNKLEEIKRPDAFQPEPITPYNSILINTNKPSQSLDEITPGYNVNCQFGVCLPEETTGKSSF